MPLAGLESTQKMKQWFLVSLIVALGVLGLGYILALPVVFYIGFALFSAWILAVASFFGFVLPPRAMPMGAVGVVIAAVVAVIAPNRLVLVLAVAIAVGLGGGMIARLLLGCRRNAPPCLSTRHRSHSGAAATCNGQDCRGRL